MSVARTSGSAKAELPASRGVLADPVVRTMVYAALGIVIVYLAAVVGVLGTGVTQKTGPRSVAERELLLASARITPKTVGDGWVPYIDALLAGGDRTGAGVALRQARASVTGTVTAPGLDLVEARMLADDGQHERAAELADKAMKTYKARYDRLVAQGGTRAKAAEEVGYGDDYFNAALVRAYALEKLGRWTDAVALFDVYLKENRTASDILIDRGNAKVELNDKTGAEKDFRAALRFVPYDEEAKAGLKRIGVEQ